MSGRDNTSLREAKEGSGKKQQCQDRRFWAFLLEAAAAHRAMAPASRITETINKSAILNADDPMLFAAWVKVG